MPTDKEFEDIFREQLNGLEEMPPLNAWQGIREEIKTKPKRIDFGWYVVPALCFLFGIATFFGLRKPEADTKADLAKPAAETIPVAQPVNLENSEENSALPYEAGKKENQAKEELIIPGMERNSVYRTYLAVQKNAAKSNVKAPVLEASAKQNNKIVTSEYTILSETSSVISATLAQKQEALRIIDETSQNLAVEAAAEQIVVKKNATAGKQKTVTEAITETFGTQTYPEAIADTINNMVMEVPYTVQPTKKSWFGRFRQNLRSVFSSEK